MAFVRDEECNQEFERELDEVARIIKYLDPKRILHGCCRTTRILGGQMYHHGLFWKKECSFNA